MSRIFIHEVGPRDGLQIERQLVPTEVKTDWIERLIESNVPLIQVGSFVNREKMPQMADTEALFAYFNDPQRKPKATKLSALVLNDKGLDRGLASGVEFFCMGASASDTHSRKNTGMSTDEATARIIAMGRRALSEGREVQVSVQSAFGCGFEGIVPEDRVLGIIQKFLDAGLHRISLADTAGHANPQQVETLFQEMFELGEGVEGACHFHDTYGMAIANSYAALCAGVTYFESSFGGLGGCPFTKLSGGNVATEDLVHMLQRLGECESIVLDPILDVVAEAEIFFGRALPGVIHRTGRIPVADLVTN